MVIDNPLIKDYINLSLNFLDTIVIQSDYTAHQFNEIVKAKDDSIEISLNKKRWKYYRNLAGLYYSPKKNSPANDVEMWITSHDNNQQILFSVECLKKHKLTKRRYAFGSDDYKKLVLKYPDQELLIRGILNPVDLDKVVKARDFEIVQWATNINNTELVASNEYNLVPMLQRFLDNYVDRYYHRLLNQPEQLYHLTFLGSMYHRLFQFMLELRLSNCRDFNVGTFHLEAYLGSHGILKYHFRYLNLKQKLWLYRNLRYLRRHAGQRRTFELLMENLLSERWIHLAKIDSQKRSKDQEENIYPETWYLSTPLNFEGDGINETIYTLEEILDKEEPLTTGNTIFREYWEPIIEKTERNSKYNELKTKALESVMLDLQDAEPYKLIHTAFNHWALLVGLDYHDAIVRFTDPVTKEDLSLTSLQALILAMFLHTKAHNRFVTHVPHFTSARGIYVKPFVNPNDDHGILQTRDTDDILPYVDQKYVKRKLIDIMFDVIPPIEKIYSIERFWEQVVELQDANLIHRKLVAFVEDHRARGMAEHAVEQFFKFYHFKTEHIGLSEADIAKNPEPQLMFNWLQQNQLQQYWDSFTPEEYGQIWFELCYKALGFEFDTRIKLKDIQKSMLEIFEYLNSYSIQIIREINEEPLNYMDLPVMRLSDPEHELDMDIYVGTSGGYDSWGLNKATIIHDFDCFYELLFGLNQDPYHHVTTNHRSEFGSLDIIRTTDSLTGESYADLDGFNLVNFTIYDDNDEPMEAFNVDPRRAADFK